MNISDASARSLATRLQTLHDVRAQLFRASTTDELCRRAVELGRERLGFDRISIWLAHGELDARGSYGIDKCGTLRDERHAHIAAAPTSAMGRIFLGDTDLLIEAQVGLYDETGTVIGQGTHILAALWDGLHVVGALSADNLLSQTPYGEEDGEILRLYAVIIGHLHQQLLSEDARQQAMRQCAETARALCDAEHDLASFFGSMPDIAVVATPQGDILYVNPAAEQLLGYSTEELAAKPIHAWHPLALREEAEEIYTAMLQGEQSLCLLPLMAQDGTLIPVKTRVWLGTWHGVSCVYAMIKDRREPQEAEKRFEQIFRQNPSPMAITQVEEGCFIDVNEAFLATTGYARHEVLGQTVAALQLFPDATQQEQIRHQLRTAGHIDQVEMLVRRKDGSMRTGLFYGDRINYREQPHFLTVMVDITERKQIECALEMQSLVLDQIQDHVTITDFAGNITYVNAAECQSMQRSREQLAGQNVIIYGEDASRGATQQQIIDATVATGTWRGEVVNYTADGREMLMDCRTQLVRNAHGQAVALCGIATDITERKQTEAALRESEMRFRFLVDHSHDLIWTLESSSVISYVSPSWKTRLGYDPSAVVGRPFQGFVHPEDVAASEDYMARVIEARSALPGPEYRVSHADGSWRWHEASMTPVYAEDDSFLCCVGISRDITERKQAEEESARNAALLRDVVDMVPAYLCAKNSEGRFLLVNKTLADFYGIPIDTMTGMLHAELCEDEEELRAMLAADRQVIVSGQPKVIPEETMQKPDGSIAVLETYKIPFTAAAEPAVLIASADITARKQAEHSLEALHRQLDCVLNAVPDLLIAVDRDLNIRYTNAKGHDLVVQPDPAKQTKCFSRFKLLDSPCEDCSVIPVFATGKSSEREMVNPADGRVREVRAFPILAPDGTVEAVVEHVRDITERKQAEEHVQRITERLNLALTSARVGVWDWNLKTNEMIWDDRMLELYGLTRDTFPGGVKAWEQGLHSEDSARAIEECQAALRGERDFDTEFRVRRHDGTVIHIKANGLVQRDEEGNPARMIGANADITERKQQEERITVLGRMLDDAPAAITIHDTAGRFIFANVETVSLHGYDSIEEFLQVNLHELDVPESEARLAERFRKIAQEGEARFEAEHYRKDGSIFPLAILAKCIEWEGRTAVLSIATDITERKQAEQALRESEERNRLLSDVTIEGIVLHRHGVAIDMNTAMATMLGYARDALLQQDFLQFIHDDDLQLVRDNMVKDVASPYTVRMQRRNGTYFCAEIESRNFLHQGNRIRVSAVRDISERKALEAQLVQAQKMESVGRLAGGVAHDFNNMLCAIMGYAELAMLKLEGTSPLRADLDEIKRAAERSADLIRQLLAFARKQEVTPRLVDLNEAVAGMLKMLQRLIGEDIRLAWHPAIAPCRLKIDPSQLDQILANLCVNARDAISGIGTLSIETQQIDIDGAYCATHPEALPGAYVVLRVSDTGCGMASDTLNHLFEPFFTTKGVGEGTGLGLAMVYGILKQNHGFITVYSEPGQGTTFQLYFPRYVDAVAPATAESQVEAQPRGTETILIVEDEPAILTLATRILEQHGYTVLTARTPGEAFHVVDSHHGAIHLVLTDVIMPEMTGRQVVERIQARFTDIGVIFMSGYTANVIAHHGVLQAGVHFLQKPFTLQALLEKVREVLDAARP